MLCVYSMRVQCPCIQICYSRGRPIQLTTLAKNLSPKKYRWVASLYFCIWISLLLLKGTACKVHAISYVAKEQHIHILLMTSAYTTQKALTLHFLSACCWYRKIIIKDSKLITNCGAMTWSYIKISLQLDKSWHNRNLVLSKQTDKMSCTNNNPFLCCKPKLVSKGRPCKILA